MVKQALKISLIGASVIFSIDGKATDAQVMKFNHWGNQKYVPSKRIQDYHAQSKKGNFRLAIDNEDADENFEKSEMEHKDVQKANEGFEKSERQDQKMQKINQD